MLHRLLAATAVAAAAQKTDQCAPRDRRCTLPAPQKSPCVWVGPRDGRWLKIVDLEEIDPAAPQPMPPLGAPADHDRSIVFAAIAAFRDSLCPTTVQNMFDRATFPDRVRVAVVQQNKPEDPDCYETYCALARQKLGLDETAPCPRGDQVFIKRFHSDEAKGPTWARSQDADMLPRDAEFCLRTDSHMSFAKDWDVKQIQQWYDAKNEYAVLSTYVADSQQLNADGSEVNVNGVWEVPHLCSILWQDGHVRNMQAKAARLLKKPKLTTLWAAGLSFSRCHAERAVPYDPYTPYIFWGEEFSRTARFFTHGYDVYTPSRTIVAHDYKHTQGDPTHYKWNGRGGPRIMQNATIRAARDRANKRIWTLLEMPGGDRTASAKAALGPYGLGDKRSLDDLIEFTGIYLRNLTIGPNRCGNIDWVPWNWTNAERPTVPPRDAAPASLHDDVARDIWRAERFVGREAAAAEEFVAHEAAAAERFIGREAATVERFAGREARAAERWAFREAGELRREAGALGRGLSNFERRAAAEALELERRAAAGDGVSGLLIAALAFAALVTTYWAFRAVFATKAERRALGLPVAKQV